MKIQTIDMHELHEVSRQKNGKDLILDVRTPEEFAEGHVPGSKNISHEEVLSHVDELKKYDMIYIYCRSGGRVQAACYDLMVKGGFKNLVAIVTGGMPDWIAHGYPVEK